METGSRAAEEGHMKYGVCAVVFGALVAGLAGQACATDKVENAPPETGEIIALSLMSGLASRNTGVRESTAFMLGEEKVIRELVPLMTMLRDSEEESSRVIAALSLCRMGEPRGVYAVRMAARFDSSERVRTLCAWYYNQYVKPGSFEFHGVRPEAAGGGDALDRENVQESVHAGEALEHTIAE
jgi:hypothetical protein